MQSNQISFIFKIKIKSFHGAVSLKFLKKCENGGYCVSSLTLSPHMKKVVGSELRGGNREVNSAFQRTFSLFGSSAGRRWMDQTDEVFGNVASVIISFTPATSTAVMTGFPSV